MRQTGIPDNPSAAIDFLAINKHATRALSLLGISLLAHDYAQFQDLSHLGSGREVRGTDNTIIVSGQDSVIPLSDVLLANAVPTKSEKNRMKVLGGQISVISNRPGKRLASREPQNIVGIGMVAPRWSISMTVSSWRCCRDCGLCFNNACKSRRL